MIQIKNSEQIAVMKEAGRITAEALLIAGENVRDGVSTKYLDTLIREHIEKSGAKPSFLGYGGFPASACISVNDEVIHGIPSAKRVLKEGDIVKVDVGAFYRGFHGDSARTFAVGKISDDARKLIEVTEQSFWEGIKQIEQGKRIGDIGSAIDSYVKKFGFSTVKRYVGHGIGHALHEQPDVPNFGTPGRGTRICTGMALAVEPMINMGTDGVKVMPDEWTVKTADAKLSAHYENTVVLTPDGVLVLTKA